MRAVFVVLLALVALTFLVPHVTAQPPPPRNGSVIAFYNDSTCTHHIHNMEVFLPSSTKCVPEHFRHHNESAIFECTTANNQTDLSFQFYNSTAACDNTAVISYTSTAAAHTCAAITVNVEGVTATIYGHIRCEEPRDTTLTAAINAARQLVGASKKRQQSGVAEWMGRANKSPFGKLFA